MSSRGATSDKQNSPTAKPQVKPNQPKAKGEPPIQPNGASTPKAKPTIASKKLYLQLISQAYVLPKQSRRAAG